MVEARHHSGHLGEVRTDRGRGVGGIVHLLVGRRPLELVGELPQGRVHLLVPLGHLHGQPDGPAVLLDGPLQRLTDPPGGVGGEAETAFPVELVDRPHQAERSLLNEIGQVHPPVLIAARPVDHQAEVGGHHLPAGGFVPGGHPLGQLGLGGVVREGMMIEVAEEQPQAVGVRAPTPGPGGADPGRAARGGRVASHRCRSRLAGRLRSGPSFLPGHRVSRHPSPHSSS